MDGNVSRRKESIQPWPAEKPPAHPYLGQQFDPLEIGWDKAGLVAL